MFQFSTDNAIKYINLLYNKKYNNQTGITYIERENNNEKMLSEFKDFIQRGNVMDMAVGVIIGIAFGAIVTSLVNDIIMPPIGLLLGVQTFRTSILICQGRLCFT